MYEFIPIEWCIYGVVAVVMTFYAFGKFKNKNSEDQRSLKSMRHVMNYMGFEFDENNDNLSENNKVFLVNAIAEYMKNIPSENIRNAFASNSAAFQQMFMYLFDLDRSEIGMILLIMSSYFSERFNKYREIMLSIDNVGTVEKLEELRKSFSEEKIEPVKLAEEKDPHRYELEEDKDNECERCNSDSDSDEIQPIPIIVVMEMLKNIIHSYFKKIIDENIDFLIETVKRNDMINTNRIISKPIIIPIPTETQPDVQPEDYEHVEITLLNKEKNTEEMKTNEEKDSPDETDVTIEFTKKIETKITAEDVRKLETEVPSEAPSEAHEEVHEEHHEEVREEPKKIKKIKKLIKKKPVKKETTEITSS